MYLFDTDILIWIIRGNLNVIDHVEKLTNKYPTYISTISIAEVYKNIFSSEIINTDECIYRHSVVPLDDQIAKQAGLYWRDYSKQFKNLSITDCMIAATAKLNGFTVVTLNTRHFPMKGIKIQNPLK